MPIYKLEAFPHGAARNNTAVEFRPMVPGDQAAAGVLPPGAEDDRYFSRMTSRRQVIEGWASHLDYDRALPAAWSEGTVVGDAVPSGAHRRARTTAKCRRAS
jgi:hypothetical protein